MKLTVLLLDDTVIEYDNVVGISFSYLQSDRLTISTGGCIDQIYLMDVYTFEIS